MNREPGRAAVTNADGGRVPGGAGGSLGDRLAVLVAGLTTLAVLATVALGVGVVVLRNAGGTGSSSSPSPSADPGATQAPDEGLEPFYSQEITWESCRGDFECAQMEVPLDYADPGGERIEIAVLKVAAEKPAERVGSLVVNPGGPGASGTEYAASAGLVFGDPLLERFDIVGFDPRGTGESDAVDCLSDEELDAYIASDPDPDTAAEVEAYADTAERYGQGCVDNSGDLAAHVTTVEAARDMDVLRAVLGEETLTYLGASYGTKLGATYAHLFPDRAGRLVLDGAVDLSLTSRELALEQAGGFEVALRAYVEDCVDEGDCFLGKDVEAGLAEIGALLDRVDEKPLSTVGERDLAVGNAFYGIVAPLYNRDYWFLLSQALETAIDEDDGTALLMLSDLYSSRGDDGYTSNSMEANYAINCLDDPWAITADEVPAQIDDFVAASPTFGEVFAWGLVNCQGVQVQASEPAPDVTGAGAPPIVVIGTTRDPATPYAWAEALAEQLESGVLVSRDGDGHTGYNVGNDCVDEAVEDYLLEGTVPQDSLTC